MYFLIKNRESSLPLTVLREREAKWIKMTKNWDTWMSKKQAKVSHAQEIVPRSDALRFHLIFVIYAWLSNALLRGIPRIFIWV